MSTNKFMKKNIKNQEDIDEQQLKMNGRIGDCSSI